MGHSRKKKTVHKLSWIDTAILDRLGFPLTNEQGNTLITPIGYLIQKPEESASSAQTVQYLYDDEYFIRVEFQEEIPKDLFKIKVNKLTIELIKEKEFFLKILSYERLSTNQSNISTIKQKNVNEKFSQFLKEELAEEMINENEYFDSEIPEDQKRLLDNILQLDGERLEREKENERRKEEKEKEYLRRKIESRANLFATIEFKQKKFERMQEEEIDNDLEAKKAKLQDTKLFSTFGGVSPSANVFSLSDISPNRQSNETERNEKPLSDIPLSSFFVQREAQVNSIALSSLFDSSPSSSFDIASLSQIREIPETETELFKWANDKKNDKEKEETGNKEMLNVAFSLL